MPQHPRARRPASLLAVALLLCQLLLGGCAGAPARDTAVPPGVWQDTAYAWDPALVTVDRDALFRLPEPLRAQLAQAAQQPGRHERLHALLTAVFGPAGAQGFRYRAGHSTVAAQTWADSSGDCLSLTVLGYAVAQALHMPVQMQEVDGPWVFDRHGGLDLVNLHVNLLLPGALRKPGERMPRDAAVDFDPDIASRRRGTPLEESDMLARYYNNVAVQALTAAEPRRAYAYFRAAAQAQPAYAAPFANLAVMYRADGRDAAAEAALRHALALEPDSMVALHGLLGLLKGQGRSTEAAQVQRAIDARQRRDPYYWIGRGRLALMLGDAGEAVRLLEHARAMANGFEELHRFLAIAYAREGEPQKAQGELQRLADIGVQGEDIGLLQKKIQSFLR